MVHLPHLGKLRREVKEEAADEAAAAAAAPFHNNKRCRLGRQLQQQQGWCADGGVASPQHLQHDFLDEPSPLGLRLKKSPSLVDLIQMKLAQSGKATDTQPCGNPGALEKLKASNFPASLLRIGDWEWISRYEGDLVAKCYFAKHKLVWEVLDGGLKSKIEIQWSDICALKVPCLENEPGTLEIALSRQPLFFRETNPQPRKHTLWQATSDFTGGQASIHRRHFLQCPTGVMNKHIEKLVRCDPRLYSLSQQNGIDLENPYFETRCSIFEDPEDMKCQDFDFKNDDCQLEPLGFQKLSVPHSVSARTNAEATQHAGTPDGLPRYLMSSVPEMRVIKEGGASSECKLQANFFDWSGFKVPGIRHSMCKSEIVNHIGHHIYKQIYSGNLPGDCGDSTVNRQTFDELTRYLLNDSQITDATDEKMIMSRVNSLCCLLQRDSSSLDHTSPAGCSNTEMYERKPQPNVAPVGLDSYNSSLPPRRESMGDLLMHLPRISSFPHFL